MSNVRRHKSIECRLHELRPAKQMQCNASAPGGSARNWQSRLRRISEASARQAWSKVPRVAVFTGRAVAHHRSHTTSVPAARPASWRAAHPRGDLDEWEPNYKLLKHVLVRHTIGQREEERKTQTHRVRSHSSRFRGCHTVTPNPSIERTRSGSAGLASISFWAKPAPPP